MATTLSEVLGSVRARDAGRCLATIAETWMQGRTTYGGCSAALCLEAAHRFMGGRALPLRSVQVAFTGPAGGEVEIDVASIREGKTMKFIRADLSTGQGKIATTALFSFGAARSSNFDELKVPIATAVPPPEHCGGLFDGVIGHPQFVTNFDARLARCFPQAPLPPQLLCRPSHCTSCSSLHARFSGDRSAACLSIDRE